MPAEYGQEQEQDEQDQGRQPVIDQLVKILTMRSIKDIRQGMPILFGGNDQIVFLYEVIETGSECARTAAGEKAFPGEKQAVIPDSNAVAAEGKTYPSVKDFMKLPDAAAIQWPETDDEQDGDNQQDEYQQAILFRYKAQQGNQEQDGQGNDTKLDIHGDDQIEGEEKSNRNR